MATFDLVQLPRHHHIDTTRKNIRQRQMHCKQSTKSERMALLGALLIVLFCPSHGFIRQPWASSSRIDAKSMMALDPVQIAQTVDAASVDHTAALLSTLYTATVDGILKPAHEHTQPFWGPPDPYLTAGKSIVPNMQALTDLGIEKSSQSQTLPDFVQAAAAKGWKILDATSIKAENLLPGFSQTHGILPAHDPRLPAETPATFAAQVEWSARFLKVVDKLPEAAFAYALVEFFLLRPGIDLYKEDVEDEEFSRDIMRDTIAVTGVRMATFLLIAIVTTSLFG